MENLDFINPLLHGIIPEELETKANKLSAKHLACAGISSLIIGAILKKAGQNKTAAVVGSLAVPLLASACYKKFVSAAKEKRDNNASSGIEYNH